MFHICENVYNTEYAGAAQCMKNYIVITMSMNYNQISQRTAWTTAFTLALFKWGALLPQQNCLPTPTPQ